MCNPNPCGPGATCQPGTIFHHKYFFKNIFQIIFFFIGNDRSGSDRPVCTCPKGYRGDPLVSCTRGKKLSIYPKKKF